MEKEKQDFFMMSSGKRKREDFASQYQNGGFIPQQDGAGDAMSDDFQVFATLMLACMILERMLFHESMMRNIWGLDIVPVDKKGYRTDKKNRTLNPQGRGNFEYY
ncbi:hypothetical protein CsSME_00041027 [Camellia sinensis var. sinensis]